MYQKFHRGVQVFVRVCCDQWCQTQLKDHEELKRNITFVQSMKNVIHQLEMGCFSTMSWAVGGLRYGEKLISIEVSRKLREDDFFSDF